MKRRALLETTGTLLTGVALTGCLSNGGDGGDGGGGGGDPTETPTDTPHKTDRPGDDTTPESDGLPKWPKNADVVENVTLGSREAVPFPDDNRAVTATLWNGVDAERTLDVEVVLDWGVVEHTDDVAYTESLTLDANEAVQLDLATPGTYRVRVDGVGDLAVPRSAFDCNSTRVTVAVDEDGLRKQMLSTMVACADPAVAGTSVESGDGECGSEDNALVEFADESVVVDGNLVTPQPCYHARLASVDYDAEADVLSVTVAAEAGEGACVDCVGSVPYEATVEMDHGYPGEVVVHHRSQGETREKARVALVTDTSDYQNGS